MQGVGNADEFERRCPIIDLQIVRKVDVPWWQDEVVTGPIKKVDQSSGAGPDEKLDENKEDKNVTDGGEGGETSGDTKTDGSDLKSPEGLDGDSDSQAANDTLEPDKQAGEKAPEETGAGESGTGDAETSTDVSDSPATGENDTDENAENKNESNGGQSNGSEPDSETVSNATGSEPDQDAED